MNDVLDVALAVGLVGGVGAVGGELWVLSNLEGETLTVGDVPMEGVDFDPAHGVECPQQVLEWKAARVRLLDVQAKERSTHKFRAVSSANPR